MYCIKRRQGLSYIFIFFYYWLAIHWIYIYIFHSLKWLCIGCLWNKLLILNECRCITYPSDRINLKQHNICSQEKNSRTQKRWSRMVYTINLGISFRLGLPGACMCRSIIHQYQLCLITKPSWGKYIELTGVDKYSSRFQRHDQRRTIN